jgi:GNAT superfamily N-acetyltransferase
MQEESFPVISGELPALFSRVETAKFETNPDWAQLLRMSVPGNLRVLTLRDRGALVGVAVTVVGPHLMNKTLLQGVTVLIWVDPLYRNGWTGVAFVKTNCAMLRKAGVKRMCIGHAPKNHRLAAVYRRAGYKLDEISYARVES